MIDLIEQHRADLVALCRQYGVQRLDVIGSAARGDFDPASSDLDFVVEFDNFTVENAADRYLGLLVDLEDLFARKIDLISYTGIRNPYFREVVNRTREALYAA